MVLKTVRVQVKSLKNGCWGSAQAKKIYPDGRPALRLSRGQHTDMLHKCHDFNAPFCKVDGYGTWEKQRDGSYINYKLKEGEESAEPTPNKISSNDEE